MALRSAVLDLNHAHALLLKSMIVPKNRHPLFGHHADYTRSMSLVPNKP
jgi:hypothetical protein